MLITGANLEYANFGNAVGIKSFLNKTNLHEADFDHAMMYGSSVVEAQLVVRSIGSTVYLEQ